MTGQVGEHARRAGDLMVALWEKLCRSLQTLGLLPVPTEPATSDPLESVIEHTFTPVEPSESFRANLRDNLQIAIQHQADGVVVEYPNVLHYRAVLGVSAGILAAAVATLVLIFRPRPRDAQR